MCAENTIYFKNHGHADVVAALPRRAGEPLDRPLLIVAHATHKQKELFFVLIQVIISHSLSFIILTLFHYVCMF